MKTICCLGDSLTEGDYGIFGASGIANVQPEGYPYFLEKITGCHVRNFGKSGYNSTSYLAHYRAGNVDLSGADKVIIMLGTNGGLDPQREVPGNQDFRDLLALCRRDAPEATIYLCTPPHVTVNPLWSNCGYAPQVEKAVAFVRDLAAELECLDGPIFLVGDGADLTHKTLHETVEELILPPEHRKHQRAVGVGLIAARMAEEGQAPSGGALTPNYLRLSQAEREKLERQQKK